MDRYEHSTTFGSMNMLDFRWSRLTDLRSSRDSPIQARHPGICGSPFLPSSLQEIAEMNASLDRSLAGATETKLGMLGPVDWWISAKDRENRWSSSGEDGQMG